MKGVRNKRDDEKIYRKTPLISNEFILDSNEVPIHLMSLTVTFPVSISDHIYTIVVILSDAFIGGCERVAVVGIRLNPPSWPSINNRSSPPMAAECSTSLWNHDFVFLLCGRGGVKSTI